MSEDNFQWVLRGDLIPKKNLEWWYEYDDTAQLIKSQIWHYGMRDPDLD